jgi:hypothetical protein
VPRGIYVPLPGPEREALFDLADREWRRPVDQAIKLISDGLRREGAVPTDDLTDAGSRGPGEAGYCEPT